MRFSRTGGLGVTRCASDFCTSPAMHFLIFCCRFAVVAALAQRLPVGIAPKQSVVAAMRNEVIDDGSKLSAARADRVAVEVRARRSAPPCVIVQRARCLIPACILRAREFARVFGATRAACDETAAARVCAGFGGLGWHWINRPQRLQRRRAGILRC